MIYPSLGNLMDAIQQEDMGDKNRKYFQEMAKEIKIKDDIAQKVLNNRLSVIRTPAEKGKTNLQYEEYQKESKKLLDFCEKMMGKREKEADSIELEQPEGVPKVGEISKEKLNENHEGLRPLPKAHKDRLNGSPKPPRVPKVPKAGGNTEGTFKKECPSFGADCKAGKYPESVLTENKDGIVFPQEEKQISEIDKKNGKNDEGWDFESPGNLVDKKTARWIEEQNEFLGKQEEKEFEEDRKEKDLPVFNPSGPIKVLQKQRANLHTGYEQTPQHVMGAQKGQALHPPLVVTNRRAVSWRGPGKRYPLKEKRRTQWGGYGKQYGRGGERKSNQTYRTDRTQTQGHNTACESQRQGSYFPTKSTGNGQGGNGGDEDRNDKKKYRDTGIGFENDSHEESDTEDSYELEITPQQLSQVTPGGGALKIKLSRKKPLQITAGMPKRKSGTSMKPKNIQSSKQPILSSHIDTFSENTQVKRRVEAPLLIIPKHLGNNIKQQKGIPIKG